MYMKNHFSRRGWNYLIRSFGTLEKWEVFQKDLEEAGFENEEAYFEEYNRIKEAAINSIKDSSGIRSKAIDSRRPCRRTPTITIVRSCYSRREHALPIWSGDFRAETPSVKVGMVPRITFVGAFCRHQFDRLQPVRNLDWLSRGQGIGKIAIGR